MPILPIQIILALIVLLDLTIHARKAPLIDKIAAILFVLFVPFLGFILYAFIIRKNETTKSDAIELKLAQATGLQQNVDQAQPADGTVANTWATNLQKDMSNPVAVKKKATILGTFISTLAILMGLAGIGICIFIAVIMYQCSRPGAKCM